MDELVGSHEIRLMLGVSRQRINQLVTADRFPEPVAKLSQGSVWRKRDIEQWMRETGRAAPN